MGEVSSGFIAFKELECSRFAGDKVMSSDLMTWKAICEEVTVSVINFRLVRHFVYILSLGNLLTFYLIPP